MSSISEKVVPGRRFPITFAFASVSISSSSTTIKCSAETAPTLAATSTPPTFSISSEWILSLKPCFFAASRILSDSSAVNTPFSQNTSQNSARFLFATSGIMSITISTYSSGLSLYFSWITWAAINVVISSVGKSSFNFLRTSSSFNSVSRVIP